MRISNQDLKKIQDAVSKLDEVIAADERLSEVNAASQLVTSLMPTAVVLNIVEELLELRNEKG